MGPWLPSPPKLAISKTYSASAFQYRQQVAPSLAPKQLLKTDRARGHLPVTNYVPLPSVQFLPQLSIAAPGLVQWASAELPRYINITFRELPRSSNFGSLAMKLRLTVGLRKHSEYVPKSGEPPMYPWHCHLSQYAFPVQNVVTSHCSHWPSYLIAA